MKVVVVGGTGLVGSRIVAGLSAAGHRAIAASPRTGFDTLTGHGVATALDKANVLIDASNAPASSDPEAFFAPSTRVLLEAAVHAGVDHYVVLSIVGVDRLDASYFRAKVTQEDLVRAGPVPFSIVRSTQFLEFIGSIADGATTDGVVRLPPILIQPIAADEAARAVTRVALGRPLNGIIDIAGPRRFRLDEIVTRTLAARSDARRVIADPDARYFGARVSDDSLVPRS